MTIGSHFNDGSNTMRGIITLTVQRHTQSEPYGPFKSWVDGRYVWHDRYYGEMPQSVSINLPSPSYNQANIKEYSFDFLPYATED